MEKFTLTFYLAFCCILQSNVFANSAITNTTYLKILNASNNVSVIIRTLPDVEKLLPNDPDSYLKSVSQAAHVFGGMLNNTNAKQAFIFTFTNMMQKPFPTNDSQVISWVVLKRDTVLNYLGYEEIGNYKENWFAVARFLGEIRSKMIPNYTSQSVRVSIAIPSHPEMMDQIVKDNEGKIAIDNLQSELLQTDDILLMLLQHRCPFSTDANFVKQVVGIAHLTEKEQKGFN